MKFNHPNDIIIDIKVFCLKCGAQLRRANCDDMNGQMVYCPPCGEERTTGVGFSVHCESQANLMFAYEEMKRNMPLVTKFLAERRSPDE